jgi:hypothetical protein
MKEMKTIHVASLVLLMASLGFAQNGEPLMGKLKVKAKPGTAGVFIDGKYVGPASNHKSARTYKVAVGDHEVTLVDPRYEEMKSKFTIHPGETLTLTQKLTELPTPVGPFGGLKVKGFDKYAAVFLNGKFYAHADELSNMVEGLLIKPGEYTVRVEPQNGNAPHEEKVNIEEGKTVTVRGH